MSDEKEMTLTAFMKTVCRDCKKDGGEKAYRLASLAIEALAFGETYNDGYIFNTGVKLFLRLLQKEYKNLKNVYKCIFSAKKCKEAEHLRRRQYYEGEFLKKLKVALSKKKTAEQRKTLQNIYKYIQIDMNSIRDAYMQAHLKDLDKEMRRKEEKLSRSLDNEMRYVERHSRSRSPVPGLGGLSSVGESEWGGDGSSDDGFDQDYMIFQTYQQLKSDNPRMEEEDIINQLDNQFQEVSPRHIERVVRSRREQEYYE